MKTTINKPEEKPEFKPTSITLTFETQKELDMFASLQNTTGYRLAAREIGIPLVPLRELRRIGAEPGQYTTQIYDALKKHCVSV